VRSQLPLSFGRFKQAVLFFEKKEPKKLFSPWSRRVATCVPRRRHKQMDKSFFGSFFSKKELLPSFRPTPRMARFMLHGSA
jgi:hypothetical protein